MRILQLTPGTGTFFCGSCLRDNVLVRALRRQGHDAQMAPLYLPQVVEGEAGDQGRPLFFGGINTYLQHRLSLFRHTPRWLDWLFDRPGLLRHVARHAHMTSAHDLGSMTVSMLRGPAGNQAKELERLIAWLQTQRRFDVICLSNALLLGLAGRLRQALGVPVVCHLQGEDTFVDSLTEPYRQQAWELLNQQSRSVDRFIAVSHYYARAIGQRIGLERSRLRVAHNGIDLAGFEPTDTPDDPPTVGYLARMCADKGLVTLIEAFIMLAGRAEHQRVRLRVCGAMLPQDRALVAECQKRLAEAQLADRVDWHANIDRQEKTRLLRGLAAFSVPATYGESFGLYVLEAMASGVPVVQPDHAAFGELIEATGGGLLCAANDPAALADGLGQLLNDPDRAAALGRAGRDAVLTDFSDDQMARRVADALADLIPDRTGPTMLNDEPAPIRPAGA